MSLKNYQWKPTAKQAWFLSLPWSVKEAAYAGGAGSGKTDLLLLYGIVQRLHENPRFKQVFMRRTFPELRNEIIPRSREIYSKFGATLNKSDMAWTFPRLDQYGGTGLANAGAMVFLGQCEDESDVHKYDSMEINLFTPDEITSFTEYIYLYIGFTRVRTSDPSLPAIIRTAGMPGGIGHTWFKKRFVDPWPKGGKILVGKGGNKRVYVHATLQDNIDHIDPAYAQSLEALPEAEKRAKKFGDWDSYLGQVFDEFRDRRYPDEPENALHVVEPFDIPEWWPKIVIGDWGMAAHTWIGYHAISPDGRLYTYREQYWQKTKIEEWAPFVKEHIDEENPRVIKFCKSVGQDRGQEHTVQQQIESALGRSVELTSNTPGSRVAGKQLVHEYFRWKPKYIPTQELKAYNEEHALWLLRNRGQAEYNSYLDSFTPIQPETNLPKAQIFSTCRFLINTIKACTYAKPKDNRVAEDVAQFDGDDPWDGYRYAVDEAERYFSEAKDEFEKIQKRELLLQKVHLNQDWTAFYRNARALDAQNRQQFGVRRYRH